MIIKIQGETPNSEVLIDNIEECSYKQCHPDYFGKGCDRIAFRTSGMDKPKNKYFQLYLKTKNGYKIWDLDAVVQILTDEGKILQTLFPEKFQNE
jgi:hypothetical protein